MGDKTKAFIRKKGQSVLIQPIPSLGLWYIGLVDLSKKKPKIEFRTPVSVFVISIILIGFLVYQLFQNSIGNAIGAIFTLVFLVVFFVLTHPFSKYVVIEYIEEIMQSKHN